MVINFSDWESYQEFPRQYLSSYDCSALENGMVIRKEYWGEISFLYKSPNEIITILLGGFLILN